MGETGWGKIMIAGSLVAQGVIDQDEEGCRAHFGNLSCRGDTHKKLAAGGEQLFRHQDGKGRAHRASYNSCFPGTEEIKSDQLGVVAGPAFMWAPGACTLEVADKISVRIQHADGWDVDCAKAL